MSSASQQSPDYQWVVSSEPDYLALQFPPLAVDRGSGMVDGMRALFEARGFVQASLLVDQQPPAARRCALVKVDARTAELVVQIGGSASRIAVPHDDPAWSDRVFGEREVLVLVCESAIEDGVIAPGHLERDIEAGAVLAARVPAGEL